MWQGGEPAGTPILGLKIDGVCQRKMIVVFDTNIWKGNLYLHSEASAAVRTYLALDGSVIGLPEVVELEVKRHLEADLRKFRDSVQSNYRSLLAIFGELKEIVLPTDGEIVSRIEKMFDESGFQFRRLSFTEDAARESLLATIEGKRPAHRSNQFKDAAIWHACKEFLRTSDVIFVSSDKAFFENDDLSKGLAEELRNETSAYPNTIELYSRLSDLLEKVRRPIKVPAGVLGDAIDEQLGGLIHDHAAKFDFAAEEPEYSTKFFATEDPDKLYVEIKGSFVCRDVSGLKRPDGTLEIMCDGRYSVADGKFSDLSMLDTMRMKFIDENGEEVERGHHFIRAGGIVIGHRSVRNTIKKELG